MLDDPWNFFEVIIQYNGIMRVAFLKKAYQELNGFEEIMLLLTLKTLKTEIARENVHHL